MGLLKEIDINYNTEQGRKDLNEGYDQYLRWMNMQDTMMRQKTQIHWFKDGDKNTKYFHSVLRKRRRRLHIHRIKNLRGIWVQGDDTIGKAALTVQPKS